ncbi:hypothetical protein E4U09_007693 [Claviceps aff. purpurea]|uniref:Uncharacterized protein n=1 Tax=Claviceps aff. purpurea TaxID=1967640 RepID=A0A9P7QAT1_9HYPO|nr:hypothetical protein E4U09_007693 [Claviceps aff. purpurea]
MSNPSIGGSTLFSFSKNGKIPEILSLILGPLPPVFFDFAAFLAFLAAAFLVFLAAAFLAFLAFLAL